MSSAAACGWPEIDELAACGWRGAACGWCRCAITCYYLLLYATLLFADWGRPGRLLFVTDGYYSCKPTRALFILSNSLFLACFLCLSCRLWLASLLLLAQQRGPTPRAHLNRGRVVARGHPFAACGWLIHAVQWFNYNHLRSNKHKSKLGWWRQAHPGKFPGGRSGAWYPTGKG